jgi:hypothetical protein
MEISKEEALQMCRKWQEEHTKIKVLLYTAADTAMVTLNGTVLINNEAGYLVVTADNNTDFITIEHDQVERFEYGEKRELPENQRSGWEHYSLGSCILFFGQSGAWKCGFFEPEDL